MVESVVLKLHLCDNNGVPDRSGCLTLARRSCTVYSPALPPGSPILYHPQLYQHAVLDLELPVQFMVGCREVGGY